MATSEDVVLPRVPSQLIDMALEDLEACEKAGLVIDMSHWHEPETDWRPCSVCAAGAVMRQRLSVSDAEYFDPVYFDANQDQLYAIDDLRCGRVSDAFEVLELDYESGREFDRHIEPYDSYAPDFKQGMRSLAAELKAAGY